MKLISFVHIQIDFILLMMLSEEILMQTVNFYMRYNFVAADIHIVILLATTNDEDDVDDNA